MTDDDHHPELLMLHEADGEIKGRGKYQKLLDRYRREADDPQVDHILKERGPFDPGLSRTVKRYLDAGIVETDEDGTSRDIKETDKGQRYISGFERTKLYLDDSFRTTRDHIRSVVSEFGDESMNQMVQKDDVQQDKKRSIGTPLNQDVQDEKNEQ